MEHAGKDYETKLEMVRNVIHCELYKGFKFDTTNFDTTRCYKHKPEFFQGNEIHKILWYIEIQTYHLIPTRRSDLLLINK